MNWLKAWLLALSLSIFLTQVAFGTFDMKFGADESKESINNNGIGIYLNQSDRNNITGNSIIGNRIGILLQKSNGNNLTENIVGNNFEYGFFLESSNYSIILGNSVDNNSYSGISIWIHTITF